MREILFRGKCVDSNEWVEGIAFPHDDRAVTMLRQHPMGGSLEGKEVIPETVGQYAEMYDDNAEKVFEHDVIQYRGNRMGEVGFYDGCFCVLRNRFLPELLCDINRDYGFAVIGNIHDNPELLKGESV